MENWSSNDFWLIKLLNVAKNQSWSLWFFSPVALKEQNLSEMGQEWSIDSHGSTEQCVLIWIHH